MTQYLLFRILSYLWLAFGAYWMGFNVVRNAPREQPDSSNSHRILRFSFLAVTFILLFLARHRIPPLALIILALAWSMLGIYWATSGKSASSSGEFPFYRLLRLTVLAITFSLLFWPATAIGLLGARFIPSIPIVAVCGFAAALLGMGIAVWARISLGRFWSDKVVLQSNHQLIRSGPYARMRHPIYSGVLLGVLGTAVVQGEWRGLLAFAILFVNYQIKARREESLLAKEFSGFAQHARATGFFFPRFRSS